MARISSIITLDEILIACSTADFLLQSGLATEIRFHGKRYPWFVSDVTKKDWNWLLNNMMYGNLFPHATDVEMDALRMLAKRWKVSPTFCLTRCTA